MSTSTSSFDVGVLTANDWAVWKTGIDGQCPIRKGMLGDDICVGKGKGIFLPFFSPSENEWSMFVRQLLYVTGLGWMFMGVAIIADVFMESIEEITSVKKEKFDRITGRTRAVKVWNDTVANLTLMALG